MTKREELVRLAESIGERAKEYVRADDPSPEDALALIDDTAALLVAFATGLDN